LWFLYGSAVFLTRTYYQFMNTLYQKIPSDANEYIKVLEEYGKYPVDVQNLNEDQKKELSDCILKTNYIQK
jgi:hypothetical protein